MDDTAKPVIVVWHLGPQLARMPDLKFLATHQPAEGPRHEAQGVTIDDAINNLLTALAFLGKSKDRSDYDIIITE